MNIVGVLICSYLNVFSKLFYLYLCLIVVDLASFGGWFSGMIRWVVNLINLYESRILVMA